MFSPVSLQPLQGPEALTALGAAAVRVAEDSLFAYAELCDQARVAEMLAARVADEPWLTAVVGFSGPFDGEAQLSLPRALAADLGAAFCGMAADELDARQMPDFAGELANMICGLWLTHTRRAERFALAAPAVSDRTAAAVAACFGVDPCTLGIALDDTPILLALRSSDAASRG